MNIVEQEIEFYKVLKDEYMKFLTYVENLWKLKIIAIGSIISFAILNDKIFGAINPKDPESFETQIVLIGVLTIPVLAIIIDLKILETALHLKNISQYLEENLASFSIAKKWEMKNWETGSFRTDRSFLVFFSTIGISFITLFLSVFIASTLTNSGNCNPYIIGAIIIFIAGLILTLVFAKKLFKRKKTTAPNKVQNVDSR